MQNGRAATGPTDVLAALQQGRAEHLIVTRDAEITGTQCRECDHVVHGTLESCQQCGSGSVFQIGLVDEMARQAELTSATVEFSDPIGGLTRVGHVAAMLRY
jgi:peptide subunit release factor 1 (eRF1)